MNYKNILFEKKDHIAILTINRPEALNALNIDVLNELNHAVDTVATDEQIYILIITGYGRAFIAGADITQMKDMTTQEARNFAQLGLSIFRKIELIEKPVIAAINGFALGGGCELAMSCDIRIASEKAKFGQPEVNLGVIPGFAGTQRLSRLLGTAKAKELIFTGSTINAAEALSLGLVNRVVAPEDLIEQTMLLAQMIAGKAQYAVRYAKTAINRGYECDLETGMVIEKDLFGLCFATTDQKEGMTAFIEKRNAHFVNK
jgi:enoyl-CoA hydratase